MKKKVIIIISAVVLVALVIGGAYAIDMHRMKNNKPVVFSTWWHQYVPPEKNSDDMKNINEYDEAYNPDDEQSFVGTILEETTSYMIVEPAYDEYERTVADKIKVEYSTDHIDYLFGTGHKVVIYYKGGIEAAEPALIKTDDISVEGFKEWTLKVTPSNEMTKKKIISKQQPHDSTSDWHRQYNLYYYGLSDVSVEVDGQNLSLKDAIVQGKVSMYAILAKANRDVSNGMIDELVYKDGGSQVYKYPDYTIVKYHTLDGNDDMYIGVPDMDINVADK